MCSRLYDISRRRLLAHSRDRIVTCPDGRDLRSPTCSICRVPAHLDANKHEMTTMTPFVVRSEHLVDLDQAIGLHVRSVVEGVD